VASPEAPSRLNPDRLRWIDYWIGVPLCFVLTVLSKLGGRGGPSGVPRNVLFIELAEMGSTVLACPAVHRLRSSFPECRVFFLLFKHIDESVKVLNLVPEAHVLTIDVSSPATLVRDTWRFMRQARRLRIDTCVNLEMFARYSAMLTYLSGARLRVGFHPFTQKGLYIGDLFTHRVIYNPHIHTWQSLLALVQALEAPAGARGPRAVRDEQPMGKFLAASPAEARVPKLPSDPSARRRLETLLQEQAPDVSGKRLIVVNPNASKLISIRKWPLDRYAELVRRLLDDPRNACVITGLASEREDAQFILDRVKSDRLVSLAGQTSLRELIELFSMAELLITNDSGPAHFAALTDVHVIVFFGPETPELYRPLTTRCTVMYSNYACSPCVSAYNQRKSVCTNNRCLQEISVEAVHGAVGQILDPAVVSGFSRT
jgi:ADP-heptose:LPS heptosyltransferase